MRDSEVDRRRTRLTIGFAIAALLVLVAAVTPSPFVVERPGPVIDTLGDVDVEGEELPVLSITGAETYPTTGSLSLTSVTLIGGPEHPTKWLSLIAPLFDRDQRIAPRSEFFPDGVTEEQRSAVNTAMMGSSQTQAAAAAAREMGMDVPGRVLVADVVEGGPGEGVLKPEDEIRTVGGAAVADVEALRAAVAEDDGAPIELGIVRDGQAMTVSVVPETPQGSDAPVIGITAGVDYELPFELDTSLEDIGGPSAGMIFALAIYDKLTPESLTEDRAVAGTGTIDGEGRIGGIGGLPQKIAGAAGADAELFLMPIENCADIPSRLPDNMAVAPVGTLDEALDAVAAFTAGDDVPGPEACDGVAAGAVS
ncbi:hypothetical protein K8P10_002084 [Leucobacter sp. Psy1]|uniref:YlbL family protein n=1 Tax=Leucobacter sp. Psy1 TaxID=2875729 RepID=UPI001CD2CF3C|nr:S16 family serine protease [Leucobacter sp. Psy1]UBH06573.1 hypothetical protein K8P10_002084 [Leucobacter sp. Psy1]